MPIETIPSQSPRLLNTMSEGVLEVTQGHRIWWQRGGTANGKPICIIHGGPGGRSRPQSVQWFAGDTAVQWLMFDQRGCGQSAPQGTLMHNTLGDLVEDIEALRRAQGFERWAVCGGSWGALLALRYALAYPSRVSALMFRSPFLGTPQEITSFFSRMHAWLGVLGRKALGIQVEMPGAIMLQKLTQLLHSGPEEARLAAFAWDAFENDMVGPGGKNRTARERWLSNLHQPTPAAAAAAKDDAFAHLHRKFQLQAHYLTQACFLEPNWAEQLQGSFYAIENLPVEIVQGDADVVCPPQAAETLLRLFPRALVQWVDGAGHDMSMPAMHQALVAAGNSLASRLD